MFWAFDHVTCGSPPLTDAVRFAVRSFTARLPLAFFLFIVSLRQNYTTPFTTLPMALPMLGRTLKRPPPFTPGVAASERGRSLPTRLPDRLPLPLFFSMTFLLGAR